jgi:hypothetical protein
VKAQSRQSLAFILLCSSFLSRAGSDTPNLSKKQKTVLSAISSDICFLSVEERRKPDSKLKLCLLKIRNVESTRKWKSTRCERKGARWLFKKAARFFSSLFFLTMAGAKGKAKAAPAAGHTQGSEVPSHAIKRHVNPSRVAPVLAPLVCWLCVVHGPSCISRPFGQQFFCCQGCLCS